MPTSEPLEVAFAIRGPIARADLPGLCDRVCSLLSTAGDVVRCDVAGVEPDAVTVDALARLQLAASRVGCGIRLVAASRRLAELLELAGLSGSVEVRGQPEGGEQGGVEEVVMPDDPVA